jgi:hypothetical protein
MGRTSHYPLARTLLFTRLYACLVMLNLRKETDGEEDSYVNRVMLDV